MAKRFTKAPLPFQGQKRGFITKFREVLAREFSDATTFVDLFGGSGLLAHTVKRDRPDARVVYNDFDGFADRLAMIPRTNELLNDLHTLADLYGCTKAKKIQGAARDAMAQRLSEEGEIDGITVSSHLLFSGNYEASKERLLNNTQRPTTWYNNTRGGVYDATGYLDGLEITTADYSELIAEHRDTEGVVFICDPPYLNTDVQSYRMQWGLKEYLQVLTSLHGARFVYFTSNKSHVLDLSEWLRAVAPSVDPFKGTRREEVSNYTHGGNAGYTDTMVYSAHDEAPPRATPRHLF